MKAREETPVPLLSRSTSAGQAADLDVGTQIRMLRTEKHLTLAALAQDVGITRSALSQIELNQANPTLGTLKAIASALGMTIGQLFPAASAPGPVVVRPSERKRLLPRRGISYELLTPNPGGRIEFILATYERGVSTGEEAFSYAAEQCGLVLHGIAEVHLDDAVHRLEAGDSIRFDCSIPHRIVNAGSDKLGCLWAITPRTF